MMEREIRCRLNLLLEFGFDFVSLSKTQILSKLVRLFKTHAPLARNSIFGSKILSDSAAFKIYATFIESVSILRLTKPALAYKILFLALNTCFSATTL